MLFSSKTKRKCLITLVNKNNTGNSLGPGTYNLREEAKTCKPNYVGFGSTDDRGLSSTIPSEKVKTETPGPGEYIKSEQLYKIDSSRTSSFRSKNFDSVLRKQSSSSQSHFASSNNDNFNGTHFKNCNHDSIIQDSNSKSCQNYTMYQYIKRSQKNNITNPNKTGRPRSQSMNKLEEQTQYHAHTKISFSPHYIKLWRMKDIENWNVPINFPSQTPKSTSKCSSITTKSRKISSTMIPKKAKRTKQDNQMNIKLSSRCDSWIAKSRTPGPSTYNPLTPSWKKGCAGFVRTYVGISQNHEKVNLRKRFNKHDKKTHNQTIKISKNILLNPRPNLIPLLHSTTLKKEKKLHCGSDIQCFGSLAKRNTNPQWYTNNIPFPTKSEVEISKRIGPGSYLSSCNNFNIRDKKLVF